MENQITVSKATQNENLQELLHLESGYLREIGEQPLTEEQQAQLFQAINAKIRVSQQRGKRS